MKLKCKKAGEKGLACEYCEGIIEVKEIGGVRHLYLKINNYMSLPRKETEGFDCPATLPKPEESDLVEVIE